MICVDASCRKNPGPFEYRGLLINKDDGTSRVIFSFRFEYGTNNIGEFLAVVHALGYCKLNNLDYDIYTDSVTAMAWIRDGVCKTTLDPHPDPIINNTFNALIKKAEVFLKDSRPNNKILKWETKKLGMDIPADYGFKKGGKKKK